MTRNKNTPSRIQRFHHDTSELLKTTPAYNLWARTIPLLLRWNLANHLYHQNARKGIATRAKSSLPAFIVITCSMRPCAAPWYMYRAPSSETTGRIRRRDEYAKYKEVSRESASKAPKKNAIRDEALSRLFATGLLTSMRTNTPPLKVHDAGDPIRNIIRRSKTEVFLPGVLRFNNVPTKVLVEVANMNNPQDQQRLADPQWRQWFAEAFVNALRAHYNH